MSRALAILRELVPIGASRIAQTPPPFPAPEEIDRDLADELEFHIAMTVRDLVAQGVDRQAARDAARRQFGDVESIKRQCKRIALQERIMLQRINFIMMIIVTGLLIAVCVQVWTTQQHNTQALRAITAEITHVRMNTEGALSAQGKQSRGGFLYLDGDVARPGVYAMPQFGRLTVRRLIASAGGVLENRDARITVFQLDQDGKSFMKLKDEKLIREEEVDYVLAPGDHVHVERLSTAAEIEQLMPEGSHHDDGPEIELKVEPRIRSSSPQGSGADQ